MNNVAIFNFDIIIFTENIGGSVIRYMYLLPPPPLIYNIMHYDFF